MKCDTCAWSPRARPGPGAGPHHCADTRDAAGQGRDFALVRAGVGEVSEADREHLGVLAQHRTHLIGTTPEASPVERLQDVEGRYENERSFNWISTVGEALARVRSMASLFSVDRAT